MGGVGENSSVATVGSSGGGDGVTARINHCDEDPTSIIICIRCQPHPTQAVSKLGVVSVP